MISRVLFKIFLGVSAALIMAPEARAAIDMIIFYGYEHAPIKIEPEKSTGLDAIFVAYTTEGLAISYGVSNSSAFTWERYSNLGGGYAEPAPGVTVENSTATLRNPEGDMGYLITDGDRRYYFWLTDYSKHRFELEGISILSETDCDYAQLGIDGISEPIHYTTINGRTATLDQEFKIEYDTMVWSEEDSNFVQTTHTYNMESFHPEVSVNPSPLCNTTFRLSGDRFLREWDEELSAETGTYHTPSVDVRTKAEQTNLPSEDEDNKSNQIKDGTDGLGGSAPADISFYAYTTDAVLHHEWQFARNEDFEEIELRFNQQDLDYTFREEGVYYVRYVGSNADGSCEAYGETYTVSIGKSELKCPNAFSPGSSEGVNDEWKVSYRSLIDFKCWIFDRYGTQLFYFDDPSKGWDGKYHGKLVKPGAYYYVIQATGADGKKYKKSGDINILNYRGKGSSGDGGGTAPTE